MELNTGQQAAVEACSAAIRDKQPITRLFGYAGTGKTTIVGTIVEESGLDPYRVIYAAPTGKAAAVLTRKGNPAKTIHSLLYQPPQKVKEGKRREFRWTLDDAKMYLAARASLLVIDEASMVGSKLGQDIMSLGIPVLAVGDPAQLQPVNDKQFFMNASPDAQLEQIMRNTGHVLECAQAIRQLGISAVSAFPEIAIGSIGQSHATKFSQIIVGRNATRTGKNLKMRQLFGHTSAPVSVEINGVQLVPGERIICLRNNYQLNCLNGQQFTVDEIDADLSARYSVQGMFVARLSCDCGMDGDWCPTCGWQRQRLMPIWLKGFTGHEGEKELGDIGYTEGQRGMMATYGYCITAHKSQGSEWPSVLVIDEAWGREKVNWLYTAITRAQDEVVIIKPSGGKR